MLGVDEYYIRCCVWVLVVDNVLKFGASEGTCFVWVLGDGCWLLSVGC